MSVPYSNRMFHDEPISDSNHSGDALDDNWIEDGQEADVSLFHSFIINNDLGHFSYDDDINPMCFHYVAV